MDTFKQASLIIDERAVGRVGTRTRTNLLSGIVTCGNCGRKMSGAKNSGGKLTYKCKNYAECTNGVTRLRDRVDPYVEGLVVAKLQERQWVVSTQADAAEAERLHQEAETLRARRATFGEALADGTLTPLQVNDAASRVNEKLGEIDSRLERLNRYRVFDGLLDADDMATAWMALDLGRQRAIIEQLCDKIVIKPLGVSGHVAAKLPLGYNIRIHWHKPGAGNGPATG